MKKRRHSGASLVEAIVVVAVVALIVTGLIIAANASLTYGIMSKDRTRALSLAKEGIEVAQLVRNADWTAVPTAGSSYCLSSGETSFTSARPEGGCPKTIDSKFSRTVSFSIDSDPTKPCSDPTSCRIVTATVSWVEGSKERSVELESFITNWRRL